jgi:hypothetical protein
VALHKHALQLTQDWSKSVGNEEHITLVAETVFRVCLDYNGIAATPTSYVALPTQPLQLAEVWSRSVSNEGHLLLWTKRFYVTVSTNNASGRLSRRTWHYLQA